MKDKKITAKENLKLTANVRKFLKHFPKGTSFRISKEGNLFTSMHNKTLIEDWHVYTQYLTSPDSFIEMSFYYMIGAALQRRVWIGSSEMPIFPNVYYILVGDPGIGKGIVIKPTVKFIKHHRIHRTTMDDKIKVNLDEFTPEKQQEIREYMAAIEDLKRMKTSSQNYIKEDDLLFPVPADATTFEAFVNAQAQSSSYFRTPKEMKGQHKSIIPPSGIYSHASMSSMLEELSSLFCKQAEKVVNYLLVAWDCGDYIYATKNKGFDKIQNCCLSMLAGTTPGFLRESFNDRLVDEGYSARAIFIYEKENRFHRFGVPNYSEEQLAAEERILNRLKYLSTMFGQYSYTTEAYDYLKHYFEKTLPTNRVNTNLKLQPYYSKKVQHVQKLAMAIHAADFDSMVIELDTVKLALSILAKLEVNMHFALSSSPKQVHGIAAKKIVKFLGRCQESQSIQQMWNELEGDIKITELREVLEFLVATDQIEKDGLRYKIKTKANK